MALATDKVRWGLLSTAWINAAMVGPMQRSARSRLVAVASRSLEKAEAYAAANNIPRAYGSYEELVEDPEIDAAYNPLPNTLHAEWTIRAARAGKHVMCEKPLVTRLEDLQAVEAAAREHRVTVFEAVSFLHHPQIRTIRQMIAEGRLGEVELVMCWDAFCLSPEDRGNIRLQPELAGGGLWDVGVYPNAFAIALAGGTLPSEVWAQQTVGPTGVDLTLIGQMRFPNRMVAQISCGMQSAGPPRGADHRHPGNADRPGPPVGLGMAGESPRRGELDLHRHRPQPGGDPDSGRGRLRGGSQGHGSLYPGRRRPGGFTGSQPFLPPERAGPLPVGPHGPIGCLELTPGPGTRGSLSS